MCLFHCGVIFFLNTLISSSGEPNLALTFLQERVRIAASAEESADGPSDQLEAGEKVVIHGLHSAVDLNGKIGTIQGFDVDVGRYVIRMASGKLKRVRPDNLDVVRPPSGENANLDLHEFTSSAHQEMPPQGQGAVSWGEEAGGLPRGTRVVLGGLKHMQSLNGREGMVRFFDFPTGRYVVDLPGDDSKRIRPSNLRPLDARVALEMGHRTEQGPESFCQKGGRTSFNDVGGFLPGAKVILHNLTSQVALNGGWNGMVGVVHCFDKESKRYVVALPDGVPRKIKADHLVAVERTGVVGGEDASDSMNFPVQSPTALHLDVNHTDGNVTWTIGSHARLIGLKTASWLNGLVAVIRGFDNATQRYLVQVPGGALKRVKQKHLSQVPSLAAHTKLSESGAPVQPSLARLSVCNAYPAHALMQVFAIPSGGKKKYVRVIQDLEFRSCADAQDFPDKSGTFAFVVGRLQVARIPFNTSLMDERKGLELTVFRNDSNSLKAAIRQEKVDRKDLHAYYLHVVNGYAGAKLLELHVERGKLKQRITFDKTYRLTREQQVTLTLTDGFQRLQMGFQPRRAQNYMVIATGAEAGLRGEPHNVGLIAHEDGSWTTSEEMTGEHEEAVQESTVSADSTEFLYHNTRVMFHPYKDRCVA